PIEELYDTVSRAKVLIYPSHQDGFSLVVLDTLALGTSIVAYDIPAIRSVYSGLKPVRIVKEYDIKSMARAVNEVLKMSDEEYEIEHNDEEVRKFLDDHSSW
ncbi:MAG: glycosyltransferase, partial [Acidianus infernus]|nr:glycosyltransferase [Acidianus infernus]